MRNKYLVLRNVLGKPVYFLDIYNMYRFQDSLKTPIGWVGYKYDSSFVSLAKIRIVPTTLNIKAGSADSIKVEAVAEMPQQYHDYIASHPGLSSSVFIEAYNKYHWLKGYQTGLELKDIVNGKIGLRYTSGKFSVTFSPQLPKGIYYLRFVIGVGNYNPTHNSEKIKLVIE